MADDGGAGASHLEHDEELKFELTQQEQLFQKCVRSRVKRDAKAKKEEAAEKKRVEEAKKREALELAFDGEVDRLLAMLEDGLATETCDAYNTTLLSETAAGGSEECVQIFVGHGADPNRLGRNRRTPLWRAANAGHAGCVQLLLRAGGDPRTTNDAAQKPYDVANGPEVKSLLECWDVSVTESLKAVKGAQLKKQQKASKEKEKKQTEEMANALEQAERRAQIARTEAARKQKIVVVYRLEKVNLAEAGALEKMNGLIPILEAAEAEMFSARKISQEFDWQLKRAKLKVRDFENKLRRKNAQSGDSAVSMLIWLKDLSDVMIKDVGGKRQEDGRWPLLFDPTKQAMVFFDYCGAVTFTFEQLACYTSSHEKEEKRLLQCALLKHLMYGGTLAISLGDEVDNMHVVESAFNDITSGLFNTLTDRAVLFTYLLPRRFMDIVPEDMRRDFDALMFTDELISKFTLIFVVSGHEPSNEVLTKDWHPFYITKIKDEVEGEGLDDEEEAAGIEPDAEAEGGGCLQVGDG